MKKLFALLLAVVMVLGLVACAQPADPTEGTKAPTTTQKPADGTTAGTTVAGDDSYFPLKEETTLKIAIPVTSAARGLDEMAKALEKNVLMNELLEKTNVKIELVGWTNETITAMFANDEMGDIVICGGSGNDNLFNGFAGEGVLASLNDYVDNAEYTPNINETIWKECPEARATFTTPSGDLYVMGTYSMDRSGYLEGAIFVYEPWLKAWAADGGKEEIKSLEDYEAFMDYCTSNDMNGNGEEDEVGVYFSQAANVYVEAYLGLFGLPTKDGSLENYVTVVEGTDDIAFIPQMDEWKDFIKLFAKWWKEGWLHKGVFTDTNLEYDYVYNSNKIDTVMVATCYGKSFGDWVDGANYVPIAPFKAGEADVRWYIHPGYMGSKSVWCVPAASENVELAVRFMDLFYSTDVSLRSEYGEADSPWRTTMEDGSFYTNVLDTNLQDELYFTEDNCLDQILILPRPMTQEIKDLKKYTAAEENSHAAYDMYLPYLNQDVWPRPYTPAEDKDRLAELRTDIFNLVNEKRAEWIYGRADIDAEWEDFQQDLLDAGVEELVEIMQGAYDVWFENYSKVAGK